MVEKQRTNPSSAIVRMNPQVPQNGEVGAGPKAAQPRRILGHYGTADATLALDRGENAPARQVKFLRPAGRALAFDHVVVLDVRIDLFLDEREATEAAAHRLDPQARSDLEGNGHRAILGKRLRMFLDHAQVHGVTILRCGGFRGDSGDSQARLIYQKLGRVYRDGSEHLVRLTERGNPL